MSLGIVLDVAIGLAFTYLLMAIIVSGVVELIAGWAKWRGKDLRNGLASLLGADKHPFLDQLFQSVFRHGLISETSAKRLPSYVPSRNFALALADVLKNGAAGGTAFNRLEAGIAALPSGAVKQTLSTFVSQAAGNAEALQKRIETWFDDAMDRLTGDYKRHTQLWMLALGFAAAVILNVDSITLARTLWTDPATRNTMVAAAQQHMAKDEKANATEAKQRIRDARCELQALPLPIGWSKKTPSTTTECEAAEQFMSLQEIFDALKTRFRTGGWVWMIVGWILTAMAVSFGAPFWFDALKNLLNMRNAGPKPPRAEAGGVAR